MPKYPKAPRECHGAANSAGSCSASRPPCNLCPPPPKSPCLSTLQPLHQGTLANYALLIHTSLAHNTTSNAAQKRRGEVATANARYTHLGDNTRATP